MHSMAELSQVLSFTATKLQQLTVVPQNTTNFGDNDFLDSDEWHIT